MIPFGLPPAPPGSPIDGPPPGTPGSSRRAGARDGFASVFHEFIGRHTPAGPAGGHGDAPAGTVESRRRSSGDVADWLPQPADTGKDALDETPPFVAIVPAAAATEIQLTPSVDRTHAASPAHESHAPDAIHNRVPPFAASPVERANAAAGAAPVEHPYVAGNNPAGPGSVDTADTAARTATPPGMAAPQPGDQTTPAETIGLDVSEFEGGEEQTDIPLETVPRAGSPETPDRAEQRAPAPAATSTPITATSSPDTRTARAAAQNPFPAAVPAHAGAPPQHTSVPVSAPEAAAPAALPQHAERGAIDGTGEKVPETRQTFAAQKQERVAAANRMTAALAAADESHASTIDSSATPPQDDVPPPAAPRPPGGFADMAAAFVTAAAAQARPVMVAAAATGAPLWAPPVEQDLQHQIVQSLWLHGREGGGEARVRLKPEYLGELSVRVSVQQGMVTARLEAETPAVREWIERHEASLRQALGDYGLKLESLTVEEPARDERPGRRDGEDRREHEQSEHRSRRPRRRAGEDEPRFEVLV